MKDLHRREFLATVGGLAGAAAFPWAALGGGDAPARVFPDGLPPHRPLFVPGVHAYGEKSVHAGEMVRFRVSSTVAYELSVCRLGPEVDEPSSDEVLFTFPRSQPRVQPLHPGSYIHVERVLDPAEPIEALSLECWVRPWRLEGRQGLISQCDEPRSPGYALMINESGNLEFVFGDGGPSNAAVRCVGPRLQLRSWQHVVATYDGRSVILWLDAKQVGRWSVATKVTPATAPLRLAAAGEDGVASMFLDGDLSLPAIYSRVLAPEEVEARHASAFKGGQQGPVEPPRGVLAFWPLAEERGEEVADRSGHGRHGRIINHATWMIGGPSFQAGEVPRFGDYDPAADPRRGHALRFASDDLYDCRWEVTHEYTIPRSARSGIYVGRLCFELDGKPRTHNVTFVVKKARKRRPAPILMLCSSSTWLAYSATPFAVNAAPRQSWGTGGLDNSHPQAPAYSFYRDHHAGQPAFQMGLNLPWPAAGPDVLYSPPEIGYSHLMRTERFAHNWLAEEGYSYDVVTDLDLHRRPDMLADYKVLVINGHSEYWSEEAYLGLERFLASGGAAVVLSGNTMFWRVSFDEAGTVMECRKYDRHVGGSKQTLPGELYHSHDGRRGGLMRECGLPAWKVIGLECSGWWGTRRESNYGVYTVVRPDHFLLERPEAVALGEGDSFGHAPGGGLPRCGGHEADVRLSTLKALTPLTPEAPPLPEEPDGIVTLARLNLEGVGVLDYLGRWGPNPEGLVAEVIYWERPQGGRVFHCGTIASGWALSADPKLQALMRNVLYHFGVEPLGK